MNAAYIFCFFLFCHFSSGNAEKPTTETTKPPTEPPKEVAPLKMKCYVCSDIQSPTLRCDNGELLGELAKMPKMGLGKCKDGKIKDVECETSCEIKRFEGCKKETLGKEFDLYKHHYNILITFRVEKLYPNV